MFIFRGLKNLLTKKVAIIWLIITAIILIALPLINTNILQSKEAKQSYSMVKYIEEVNETVFLNVGIESVETQTNNTSIPWTKIGIPLTEKKAIIILNYEAKLGIKKPVKINEINENQYKITIPSYEVIGIDLDKDNPYRLYDSSGELLSYSTDNVDTGELVTKRISSDKQKQYINQYKNQMNNSAKEYYQTLFKSIDENIKLEFVFSK